MLIYIIKKVLSFLLILLLLSLLSAAIIYTSPDNIFDNSTFFHTYYAFYHQLFIDQLTASQYSVWQILRQILLPTFELCILAIICSIVIGFPIGIIAGLKKSNKTNQLINLICLILYASPIIWIAILVMLISTSDWQFIKNTHYLPTISGFSTLDILLTPNINKFDALIALLKYLWLPVIILTIQPCIVTIQLISQRVNIVSRQNYIKVANIRENSSVKVLFRHLLPNAIPETIPQLAYNITTLLFSTMTIEILFNRAGLGGWVFSAFHQQNYFIIALAILSCGALISLLTLLSEILVVMLYPIQSRALYE